jgi:hypothetical protein
VREQIEMSLCNDVLCSLAMSKCRAGAAFASGITNKATPTMTAGPLTPWGQKSFGSYSSFFRERVARN